jgi:hypothetical protein
MIMATSNSRRRKLVPRAAVMVLAAASNGCGDVSGPGSPATGASSSGGVPGVAGTATSGGVAGTPPGGAGGAATAGTTSGGVAGSGGTTTNAGTNNGGMGGLVPFEPPTCADGSSTTLPATAPELTAGMFVNISPPGVPFDSNATALTQGMTIDPCNPATIYVCVVDAEHGIYRSSDGGGTWTRLDYVGGCPIRVRVNPENPLHLYVGDGVRGGNNGFFYTTDGGVTWTLPQGFKDFADEGGSYDVYHVEPDPADFSHVLVSFHSGWKGEVENGVIESFDAGVTWRKAGLPGAGAEDGTDVYFLYEPKQGIGNAQTWLFATQGNGHFRTTNSGETWTKVTDVSMQHGGGAKYYGKGGVLYISSSQGVLKSTDNGETFTKIGLGQAYLSVIGDGTRLFAGQHFNARFVTALESNDTEWTEFNMQDFDEGPFEMAVDPVNQILYSANIRAGVYALKLE